MAFEKSLPNAPSRMVCEFASDRPWLLTDPERVDTENTDHNPALRAGAPFDQKDRHEFTYGRRP